MAHKSRYKVHFTRYPSLSSLDPARIAVYLVGKKSGAVNFVGHLFTTRENRRWQASGDLLKEVMPEVIPKSLNSLKAQIKKNVAAKYPS